VYFSGLILKKARAENNEFVPWPNQWPDMKWTRIGNGVERYLPLLPAFAEPHRKATFPIADVYVFVLKRHQLRRPESGLEQDFHDGDVPGVLDL